MPVNPNALATWANAVTVSRILVSPLLCIVVPDDNAGSWLAAWLWFGLCVSDVLDGYLARRHGTTKSGAFLDPLADKVLVLGAMFTLVSRDMFGKLRRSVRRSNRLGTDIATWYAQLCSQLVSLN